MKAVAGLLLRSYHHTLVVGNVGVGKTLVLSSMLEALPAERSYTTINFSAQTSSNSLQVRADWRRACCAGATCSSVLL